MHTGPSEGSRRLVSEGFSEGAFTICPNKRKHPREFSVLLLLQFTQVPRNGGLTFLSCYGPRPSVQKAPPAVPAPGRQGQRGALACRPPPTATRAFLRPAAGSSGWPTGSGLPKKGRNIFHILSQQAGFFTLSVVAVGMRFSKVSST